MIKGEKLTYIRHERNTGIGKDSGQPFDFANITLSDGLESFELEMKPELNEEPKMHQLKKGDVVNLTIDVYQRFRRTAFQVVDVKLADVK